MKIKKAELSRIFGFEKAQALLSLYSQIGLSDREKNLCTIACFQALGDSNNLTEWLGMTLTNKKALKMIYEVLLQGYLFCGYPKAIESFFCLESATRRNGHSLEGIKAFPLDDSKALLDRGRALAGEVHRDKFARIYNKISAISPDLGYLMIAEGYGHILCRPGLDLRTRELAIVSCLTGLGALRQLNSHIRGALNVGCLKNEIFGAMFLCSPWIGGERVRQAAGVCADLIEGELDMLSSAYNWI